MRSVIVCLLVVFFLASCDSKTIVSETQSLPGYWDKNDTVNFTLPELDSLQKYDMFLHVRNTNVYKYNNLFLIVSLNFPHGKTVVDTLEYRMANADGSWLGQGIGNVKENKLWYKEQVQFLEEGNYNITITHAVRNNGEVEGVTKLEGITDVGYSIEATSKQ